VGRSTAGLLACQAMSAAGRAPTPPVGGPETRPSDASTAARAQRPMNGTLEMDASQAIAAGLLGKVEPGASLPLAGTPAPPAAQPSGSVSAQKGADPLLGTTIDGRYVVDKRLGEGGMGVVYLARHRVIDRKVALKVLRAEFARDHEIVERFLQEAKTASSIGNPHIVDIHDFGVLADGSTYFAMEFLDGEPLMDVIVREKMPLERIVQIGVQICDGLGAAHERGIVHRDLKPDNVYLLRRNEADFVKVLDFGIAKVEHAAGPKLTRAGAVFGTPHYMSPEQAAGTPIDHRADIYALGVILYEMATGQLPFDSDNAMTILSQHMYKAPMPLRSLVQGADRPAGLEAIVQKCLLKRPEHRYATMAELSDDLKRLARGEAPKAISDLMARSSSTGIPADYFRAAGSATGPILPASPSGARSKHTGLVIAGVALLTTGLAAAGLLAMRASDSGAPGLAVAADAPEAPSSAASPAAKPAEPTATGANDSMPPSGVPSASSTVGAVAPASATSARASAPTPTAAPAPKPSVSSAVGVAGGVAPGGVATAPKPTQNAVVAPPTQPRAPASTKPKDPPPEGPIKIF
jgi:eukaryotic-like serine/threonine-protein kinase